MLVKRRLHVVAFIVICCFFMFMTNKSPYWTNLTLVDMKTGAIGSKAQSSLTRKDNVCVKGKPLMTKAWLQKEFQAFAKVYKNKLAVNGGGTRLSHQFALWSVIKVLKPKHIIESGIWNGLGTWILRQAAPEAQIILLDPLNKKLTYRDTHKDTLYFTGGKFRDFSKMQWDKLSLNKNETLIFFDDHQSAMKRTIEAWHAGFRHIMFDDNLELEGDNFSLKEACELEIGKLKWEKVTYKDNFRHITRNMDELDRIDTDFVFAKAIESYQELPMVWSYEGGPSNVVFANYSNADIATKYGLEKPENGYANICYANLKFRPFLS